jgi:hypothetical protein
MAAQPHLSTRDEARFTIVVSCYGGGDWTISLIAERLGEVPHHIPFASGKNSSVERKCLDKLRGVAGDAARSAASLLLEEFPF